jgi:hypothetical protein
MYHFADFNQFVEFFSALRIAAFCGEAFFVCFRHDDMIWNDLID